MQSTFVPEKRIPFRWALQHNPEFVYVRAVESACIRTVQIGFGRCDMFMSQHFTYSADIIKTTIVKVLKNGKRESRFYRN